MLKDSFCSSPWHHLKITYNGDYKPCRWGRDSSQLTQTDNVSNSTIMQYYNSDEMKQLRTQFLNGSKPDICSVCYYEESNGKLNGRLKQLNKSGVLIDHFDLSLRSSPHYKNFLHSKQNQGHADYNPVDLQIDLGNTCNSACIMCNPVASSKLQNDYKKLELLEPTLFKSSETYRSWTRDTELVDKFVEEAATLKNLRYIHFLGGETLYEESFYLICEKLIETGIAKDIAVGTTTNGTIYNTRLEKIIKSFKEFHLGLSIESVTKLNDYIRYPSSISDVLDVFSKFYQLRSYSNLHLELRITPNIFTIYEFDKLVEYMLENNVMAESCNILYKPSVLRMELMPENIRQEIISKLESICNKYNFSKSNIVNIRNNDYIQQVIADTTLDYLNFLKSYPVIEDIDGQRKDLIKFLKAFESLRDNSILNYAPHYEEFLRHHGY